MIRRALPSALLLTAVFAAACEQSSPTDLAPLAPQYAKPGSGGGGSLTSECGGSTILLDSRVHLDWGTSTSAGITSDGGGLYKGDVDGVHAKIFYHDGGCSRSGDMVFDPDMQQKNGPRKLVFVFGENNAGVPSGAYASAPFVNFRQLMQLGSDVNKDGNTTGGRDQKIEEKSPGAERGLEYPATLATRPSYPTTNLFRIGTSAPGCETLEYESITLQRTGGVDGFVKTGNKASDGLEMGQWEHGASVPVGTWVVSGGNARCYKTVKGKLELNGDGSFFSMPFSVTVTEVRK